MNGIKKLLGGAAEVKKLRRRLTKSEKENAELKARLAAAGDGDVEIRPENIVWIFGSGRSGSTWLARMMGEMPDHTVWNEPLIGALFGQLYYVRAGERIDTRGKHFILGDGYRESWLEPMRELVLRGAAARFPDFALGGYLVVKEPNGSVGAPLLMETLPESRMILLIRDPRDVAASNLDARRGEGWITQHLQSKGVPKKIPGLENREENFIRKRARNYVESITRAKQAYESHEGYKSLVLYEELRADTLRTMKRIYAELEIPVSEEQLSAAVERHSWENIPEEKKGEGKFHRKGTPGGWKEDLSPRQVRIVEKITAPILEEFYPS